MKKRLHKTTKEDHLQKETGKLYVSQTKTKKSIYQNHKIYL